jgi:sialic acid synthase SpsE
LIWIAKKDKPMIVSTGMASLDEVEVAVRTIKQHNDQIALLHCVSEYPADPADLNLRAMQTMANEFDTVVGFSDHTLGIVAPLVAVALGASIIEKHFTIDCSLPGPDHRASLEPAELSQMIEGIRIAEAVLGDGQKRPTAGELKTASVVRKSLVAARDIPAGTVLTADLIAMQRPGTGLPPAMRDDLIGRTVQSLVKEGTPFTLEILA